MGLPMPTQNISQSKSQTQEQMPEIDFLQRFKCVAENKQNKTYTIYNCDAYNKVNKDNIAQVLNDALTVAQQFNAVVRLFRVLQLDAMHSVSITVTRGGLISIDIRFPQRVGGFQNVLTIRPEEIPILKMLVEKLVELVQAFGI
jgi:hypothetical protein